MYRFGDGHGGIEPVAYKWYYQLSAQVKRVELHALESLSDTLKDVLRRPSTSYRKLEDKKPNTPSY